jgi:glycosyltransferase involved in cell wall biosynthesis
MQSLRVVLATGIYPPQIGGPATYTRALAEELTKHGVDVTVIAYGAVEPAGKWQAIGVPRMPFFLFRWLRYAAALRRHAANADIVYAFSSISCGIPLMLSGLPRRTKRVLRLGGDFLWERHADRGGNKTLSEWYASKPFLVFLMQRLLKSFDHLVFSTNFQRDLYAKHYRDLPAATVIENPMPGSRDMQPRTAGKPLRLLWMGRMTPVKNLEALLYAMADMEETTLLLVGSGRSLPGLRSLAEKLDLEGRVAFCEPVKPAERDQLLQAHHALVLPSLSEVSPNIALEARAAGMPVVLTVNVGLSEALASGMLRTELRTAEQIYAALSELKKNYPTYAAAAAQPIPERGWGTIAEEHLRLFRTFQS